MNKLLASLNLDTEYVFLGAPIADWIYASVIGVGTFMLLMFLRRLMYRRVYRYSHSADLPRGIRLLSMLAARTQVATLFALSIVVASKYLDLTHHAEKLTTGLIIILVGWQVGIWLSTAVRFYLAENQAQSNSATSATSMSVVEFVARGLIWFVVILAVLDNLGVNISTALTGLGIGGVAVALAVQNILGDLFASLSIAMDKPFLVGDSIVVDNLTGTVESVGVKSTRLRSNTGEQIILSNADMLKARVRNWGRVGYRRRIFVFRVAYATPLEHLRELPALVEALVQREPQTRFERCSIRNLTEVAIEFEVSFVSEDASFEQLIATEQSIYLGLLQILAERSIEIPTATTIAIPTRT